MQGLIKRAELAKVAVFACGLEMSSTETKGTVLIRTGEELMSYNKVQHGGKDVARRGTGVAQTIVSPALNFVGRLALFWK